MPIKDDEVFDLLEGGNPISLFEEELVPEVKQEIVEKPPRNKYESKVALDSWNYWLDNHAPKDIDREALNKMWKQSGSPILKYQGGGVSDKDIYYGFYGGDEWSEYEWIHEEDIGEQEVTRARFIQRGENHPDIIELRKNAPIREVMEELAHGLQFNHPEIHEGINTEQQRRIDLDLPRLNKKEIKERLGNILTDNPSYNETYIDSLVSVGTEQYSHPVKRWVFDKDKKGLPFKRVERQEEDMRRYERDEDVEGQAHGGVSKYMWDAINIEEVEKLRQNMLKLKRRENIMERRKRNKKGANWNKRGIY